MEAIILAEGRGQRLKEVVSDVPKPMANIKGKPFLEYLLIWLSKNNINKVSLAVGYKGYIIKKYFSYKYKNIQLRYS